jgi:hypothetical protein
MERPRWRLTDRSPLSCADELGVGARSQCPHERIGFIFRLVLPSGARIRDPLISRGLTLVFERGGDRKTFALATGGKAT